MNTRWLAVLCLIGWAVVSIPGYAADVYVIDIRDAIGKGLKEYIQRGIEFSEENVADVIVFDINTPGGRIDAMWDIVDVIHATDIPTIAFVNSNAYSAGAVIALACEQIVMNPNGGVIGDAAPVSATGEEMGEKIVSGMRGKIQSTAEANGRNPDVAAAMVDKTIVLVRLDGALKALTPTEYAELKDRVEEVIADEGKLLTLRTKNALEFGFINAEAETVGDLVVLYELVTVDGKVMALTTEEISSKQELGNQDITRGESLATATVTRVQMTIAERIAALVTSPMLSALLMSLGMLGIFLELRTPGFGLPGLVGIFCLALVFGGHALARVSAGYAALAFVAGLGLVLLEIFVIPGFGVAGISGIALMVGSVVFLFGRAYDANTAMFWLGSSFIATVVVSILLISFLPKTRLWQSFILSAEERTELGYHAPDKFDVLVGKMGKTLTPLRPSGSAVIGGQRVDVVTEGGFVVKDRPVMVIETEGVRVVVRPLEEMNHGL